jgi:hypothetical protein
MYVVHATILVDAENPRAETPDGHMDVSRVLVPFCNDVDYTTKGPIAEEYSPPCFANLDLFNRING